MTNSLSNILEQIELPFVVFDSQFNPVILSQAAARTLEIRDKANLRDHLNLFEPLREFARQVSTSGNRLKNSLSMRHQLQEIELATASGRVFNSFAYTSSEPTLPGIPSDSLHLIVFQDLTYFEPFFKTIDQSRRSRSLIVLLSSYLGHHIDLRSELPLSSLADKGEEFLRTLPPLDQTTSMGSDVSKDLSTAVDIVDPLIVPSSKILIETQQSAILAIPRPVFLRLLSHLLLEATDFGGPFGKTVVSAGFIDSSGTNKFVISIKSKRATELPLTASPMEVYLYRLYAPSQYRVSVAEPESPESVENNRRPRKSSRTISRELLSENLVLASELGRPFHAIFSFTRSTPVELEMDLTCPLA